MDISAIVAAAIKDVKPLPTKLEELTPREQKWIAAKARTHGVAPQEVLDGIAKPEDVESDEEAAEIARQARERR